MNFRPLTGLILALAFPLLAPGNAAAETLQTAPKAVVELFTSQGCSSCPKADQALETLIRDGDVVALAYHVDYWDYIGWPDTFGAKENSDRQRDYAEGFGSSRIFTPQMVVNGHSSVVASREGEVEAALSTAALPVAIDLEVAEDGMLEISVPAEATDREAAMRILVTWLSLVTL